MSEGAYKYIWYSQQKFPEFKGFWVNISQYWGKHIFQQQFNSNETELLA